MKKNNKNDKPLRLQFDFAKESVDRLDNLKLKTNAATRAALIRSALGVYDLIVSRIEEGYKLQFVKGSEVETILPIPPQF